MASRRSVDSRAARVAPDRGRRAGSARDATACIGSAWTRSLIEKVYGWAQQKNALLFLDIQVGHSTLQAELPRLLPFLARPNVHLGIDPEFSMHYEREGMRPSTKIGEMSADDVNYVVKTLTQLVQEKHLPPKILVVHRFTQKMVLGAPNIHPTPQVQVVMDMDGWGPPWLKFDSYRDYIDAEPVQFTGFKIFFHNDVKTGRRAAHARRSAAAHTQAAVHPVSVSERVAR